MYEIIRQVMRKNHKVRNGKLYISTHLFKVLTDLQDLSSFTKQEIDLVEFIEIESIPYYLRNEFGLYRSKQIKHPEPPELPEIVGSHEKATDSWAESSIKYSLSNFNKYRHEFIDHFIDENIIATKSLTLTILKEMETVRDDKVFLLAIYDLIVSQNIQCELPKDSFQNFYKKYRWFCRAGFVNGLIRDNFNPNSY